MWLKPLHILILFVVSHQTQASQIKAWVHPNVTVEGETVILYCATADSTHLEVIWSRKGRQLIGPRYELDENDDLRITTVTLDDSGEYVCRIANGTFEASTALTVKKQTIISNHTLNHLGKVGETIVLPCNVIADQTLAPPSTNWFRKNEEIPLEGERYSKSDNHSLIIWSAASDDSGYYTCSASTELDSVSAAFQLTVAESPHKPHITSISCSDQGAIISWTLSSEDRLPIQQFIIEYNTTFEPGKFYAIEKVPGELRSHYVELTPWLNYSLQITAHSEFGQSKPSEISEMCTTKPSVPCKNPKNVRGEGTTPTNLVIYWEAMPQIEHYGPDLNYRVHWKQDTVGAKWNEEIVHDWNQNNFVVSNQPTFARYCIKVEAFNKIGKSSIEAAEVIGYSGEGTPTEVPANLSVTYPDEIGSVVLSWQPVATESINGHFKAYAIQIWRYSDKEEHMREVHVNATQVVITRLNPAERNYARVSVLNGRFHGPSTDLVRIKLSEGVPGIVEQLDAFPLGQSSLLLRWMPPTKPNGQITGYNIYYKKHNETVYSERQIHDSRINQTKLTGLEANTKYQLSIGALTSIGEGQRYNIEVTTKPEEMVQPNSPGFKWEFLPREDGYLKIKVIWLPDMNNPGSNFYVKYRIKGKLKWTLTNVVTEDDFIVIDRLLLNETYEIVIVSIDGDYAAESAIQEISREKIHQVPQGVHYICRNIILGASTVILSFVFTLSAFKLVMRRHEARKSLIQQEKAPHGNQNYAAKIHSAQSSTKLNFFVSDSSRTKNQYQIQNRRMFDSSGEIRENSNYDFTNFEEGNTNCINPQLTLDEQADLLPYDQKYEFPRERLQIGKQLGAGAFGVVFQATAQGIRPHEEVTTVAVKMARSIAGHEVLRALTLELKILVHLGRHLNVVNLLGAITKNITKRELMLIVEYCPYGNLQHFLVKNRRHFVDQLDRSRDVIAARDFSNPLSNENQTRSITTSDLLCWSFQIARGMDYLASRKVLHGDLAARNILLCDDNIVKICDFGLARSMYKTGNYYITTQRVLPFKWLALESISDQVFSTYSDVWSFGIVLWELFSLGAAPYPGIFAGADLYAKIKDGYRMEKPEYASQKIYDIMLSCWKVIPESRPMFDELEDCIFEFLDRDISEHYVDLNEPYLLANASHLKATGKTDYLALLGSPDCPSPSIPHRILTTPDASETSASMAFAYNPIFYNTNEVTRF